MLRSELVLYWFRSLLNSCSQLFAFQLLLDPSGPISETRSCMLYSSGTVASLAVYHCSELSWGQKSYPMTLCAAWFWLSYPYQLYVHSLEFYSVPSVWRRWKWYYLIKFKFNSIKCVYTSLYLLSDYATACSPSSSCWIKSCWLLDEDW